MDAPQLPGADLVRKGIEDLAARQRTVEALLVARAPERLRECGVAVPDAGIADPDGELYTLLGAQEPLHGDAYVRYNALTARLISYIAAARHAR